MIEKDILEKIEAEILKNRKSSLLKTGFNILDEIIQNAPKGSLITIGGRPSMGKSALVFSIIENISKNNEKILLIPLKDSKTEVIITLV